MKKVIITFSLIVGLTAMAMAQNTELQYHVEEENAFTEAAEAQITAVRHEIDHHSIKQRKGLH